MKYILLILMAMVVAICYMYGSLALSYTFEGYGLHPAVCAAAIITSAIGLATVSYLYGYNRKH